MASQEDPVETFLNLEDWPSDEVFLLGYVTVNLVGIQNYLGDRETVTLARDELNLHDPNAIKVLNTSAINVGYIEQGAAKVLSPLVDDRVISIDGIVIAAGRDNEFKVLCHIFARFVDFEKVKSVVEGGGLHINSESNSSFSLSKATAVKDSRGERVVKSIDEIFKSMDLKLCSEGPVEALEPPKTMIKSELFSHQKEGLGWLVSREMSCELPPFWKSKDGVYVNELTNYQTAHRPDPIRGGIFADDMGLGKTLTLLSLIAFDKWTSSTIPSTNDINEESDSSFGNKKKRGRVTKKADISNKKKNIETSSPSQSLESRTTLIVCPPCVFSAWVAQLEEHTRPGCFKVYIYYEGDRTRDVEELQKYDIVLTTYNTLAVEAQYSPMKKIEWRRIILDEAHVIKNPDACYSRVVLRLNATRRWAVTGTPIQNGSCDLFSLMNFLKFEPFSFRKHWNNLIQHPLSQGGDKGIYRLQVLMATLSLRRTKDKVLIGLPSKTIETCYVTLSGEERDLYDQMEGEARKIVKGYISHERMVVNYSTVLSILLRLRQICTHIGLCPSNLQELLPHSEIEDVKNNPILLAKMLLVLQDGEDFNCPVCLEPPTEAVITCCAHIFCGSCIWKTIKRTTPSCPMCRHPLSESNLFRAPSETTETSSTSGSSSKVTAILKLLTESRKINPSTKSVIFSQFQKLLVLLEKPLTEAGFKTLRLDGSLSAKRRGKIVKKFGASTPDSPTILLASLRASCTGINLTAASRVYLMEPWWNSAVEEQAMDRVHRIGQKEKVTVVRLIAKNTIDERILQLHEKKKALTGKALGKKGVKEQREINISDLRALMNF